MPGHELKKYTIDNKIWMLIQSLNSTELICHFILQIYKFSSCFTTLTVNEKQFHWKKIAHPVPILGIFVSIIFFLLMKIIALMLRKSQSYNIFSSKRQTLGLDNNESASESTLEEAISQNHQDIFTIPSENKIVINNINLVIHKCDCSKGCKNCPESYKTQKNCENIDQELLLSVVKNKFSNLWLLLILQNKSFKVLHGSISLLKNFDQVCFIDAIASLQLGYESI